MTTFPAHHEHGFIVRDALTAKRRRRHVENDDYAAFVRRILRAYAARVALGDIDAVADMVAIGRELDDLIQEAVDGLRDRGYSWADIGRRVGTSKQAAHERWSQRGKSQQR